MNYLGDFAGTETIPVFFNSYNAAGASVTLSGLAVTDIEIYRDGSVTQRSSDAGYTLLDTDGIDFDGVTGLHGFSVNLSDNTDAGFFASGHDYTVVVSTVTIDSQTVTFIAASFSIRNRSSLYPTTAGRTLDVSAGGEAGVDWANVGSPTTTVGLSGTTVKTATDVETDTADIQTRIPAALVGGRIDSNVGAISSDATAADNAESFFDGTGYAGTGNVIPTVTTVTNAVSANMTQISGDSVAADNAESFFDGTGYAGTNNVIPLVTTVTTTGTATNVTTVNGLAAGVITAASIATGAFDADALATDAVTEITTAIRAAGDIDGYSFEDCLKLVLSAVAGKLSGGGTTSNVIRAADDSKNRITATVDSDGNRTAITLDATG